MLFQLLCFCLACASYLMINFFLNFKVHMNNFSFYFYFLQHKFYKKCIIITTANDCFFTAEQIAYSKYTFIPNSFLNPLQIYYNYEAFQAKRKLYKISFNRGFSSVQKCGVLKTAVLNIKKKNQGWAKKYFYR